MKRLEGLTGAAGAVTVWTVGMDGEADGLVEGEFGAGEFDGGLASCFKSTKNPFLIDNNI